MPTELTLYHDPTALLIPPDASIGARYRLNKFADWLATTGLYWHQPDLARYWDEMLGTYARSTVSAYLSTIRARYREILRDNGTRDALYAMASEQFSHAGKHDTPANRKAYVDGLLTELNNAIDHAPRRSRPRCRTGRRAHGPA